MFFWAFGNYRIPFFFSWDEMEKSAAIEYMDLKEGSEFWKSKIIFTEPFLYKFY